MDSPARSTPDVLVVVVAEASEHETGQVHLVEHGPDARRAVGVEDLDLGHVAVVNGHGVGEGEVAASGVEPPASYRSLLRAERDLWRFIEARIAEEGLEAVAVLEDLRRSIARGRNPYLSDWDGHPNVVGNEVIAEAVAGHAALRALAERVSPDRRP